MEANEQYQVKFSARSIALETLEVDIGRYRENGGEDEN
jgi:hypothetical protein